MPGSSEGVAMIEAMSLESLAVSQNWSLIGDGVTFSRVSIDSRSLTHGDLYVALKGENFDGHDFIQSAVDAGACAAMVSQLSTTPISQLQTPDTQHGLDRLAVLNRQAFTGKLIALTGSAGKTTTKEMIAAVLSQCGSVSATRGNLNNEIGVPLTLLGLEKQHQYAVVEMGAAKRGDIEHLVNLASPDVALLLNACPAHLASFGSLQAIAETKGEIFSRMSPNQVAIINADDNYADYWRGLIGEARLISFGIEQTADVSAKNIHLEVDHSNYQLHIDGEAHPVRLMSAGMHNLRNSLAAAAVAYSLGIGTDQIATGLSGFTSVGGRQQRLAGLHGSTIIDDSYNANPTAVKAAADVLALADGKRLLVMGVMAELGPDSEALHADIGCYARDIGLDGFYAVGREMSAAVEAFGDNAYWFSNKDALTDALRSALDETTTLLIKGSRSTGMEQVVQSLSALGLHSTEGEG
ncbi:MAG: UDP-N-acetylmuramoyl-tripeptide--D-alanyl-D-alanine ligase [Pseudomonadales bacterium]